MISRSTSANNCLLSAIYVLNAPDSSGGEVLPALVGSKKTWSQHQFSETQKKDVIFAAILTNWSSCERQDNFTLRSEIFLLVVVLSWVFSFYHISQDNIMITWMNVPLVTISWFFDVTWLPSSTNVGQDMKRGKITFVSRNFSFLCKIYQWSSHAQFKSHTETLVFKTPI